MLMAKKRTGRISVSARCFSLLLVFVLASQCHALSVKGIPEWLEAAVTRSLNAVWSEIPASPEIDREGTLALVASRLFTGYEVSVESADNPLVSFKPNDEVLSPDIKLVMPELRGMAMNWFIEDVRGMSSDISVMIADLPKSALTWADDALRERIALTVKERLPGWDFSVQIYISHDAVLLNAAFRPGTPMILAVKPSIYSRTIPAMFRSDLEAKLISEFSPLIGIPVSWAEAHKHDIVKEADAFLEDRHSVENLKARANVDFTAGTVSTLEAGVDSEDFMFQVWVAAYAGLEGRYPEGGAFFGFRPDIGLRPEVYAELIFALNDFDITRRIGARFEVFNNFWAGAEVQWPDNKYFLRVQYTPAKLRRPYAWWRWSPELEAHEAALGYRFDEHISIEIYYDSTGDDKAGIRGLWHL